MRIMRKQLWKGFSKGEVEQLPEALAPSGKFSWERQPGDCRPAAALPWTLHRRLGWAQGEGWLQDCVWRVAGGRQEWVFGGSFVEAALFLQAFLPPPLLPASPLPPLPPSSKIYTTLYWFL